MLKKCFMQMSEVMIEWPKEAEDSETNSANGEIITNKQKECMECSDQDECYKFSMMRTMAGVECAVMEMSFGLADDDNVDKNDKKIKKKQPKDSDDENEDENEYYYDEDDDDD